MKLSTQILQHILITSSVVFLSGLKSPAKEYFVAPNGSDDHTGTLQQPFGTIQHAVQRLGPGDTLFLRAGRYHETVTLRALRGGRDNPVTLTAYAGETVTLDGSKPITSKWIRHKGPIYKTILNHDIWQLFVNGKSMSSARWPNGNWNDGSLWDSANSMAWPQPERSEFGHHFNDGLKQLDFSLEGGIIIVASGSFKTYKSRVIKHQAGSDNFVYSLEGVHQHTQGFSVGRHAYFLEGKLGLLDAEGEWFYDPG